MYYHPGHNILEFFKVLVEVLFTTSKTEPDIFMKESPDELLYDVNVKTAWQHSLVYSYPCRYVLLALVLKNHEKTDIKVFDGFSIILKNRLNMNLLVHCPNYWKKFRS